MEKVKKSHEELIELIELIVVIMLGVTAILTAWSSWVSGLHAGVQTEKYAISNNLSAEGNSEYNAAIKALTQDMMIFNQINNLTIDLTFAEMKEDWDEVEKLEWKIDEMIMANVGPEFYDALMWSQEETERTGEFVSPFDDENFFDSYFDHALELLDEAEEILQEGTRAGSLSDNYSLVTVIYAITLFMMGMSAVIRNLTKKLVVFVIGAATFLLATVYMLFQPLPPNFSLLSFFGM